jgi:hypothetical protein
MTCTLFAFCSLPLSRRITVQPAGHTNPTYARDQAGSPVLQAVNEIIRSAIGVAAVKRATRSDSAVEVECELAAGGLAPHRSALPITDAARQQSTALLGLERLVQVDASRIDL